MDAEFIDNGKIFSDINVIDFQYNKLIKMKKNKENNTEKIMELLGKDEALLFLINPKYPESAYIFQDLIPSMKYLA